MTFIDLFSGIGGFRNGLERAGHTCVGHVEIDKFANKSYMAIYDLKYCKNTTNNENTSYMCNRKVEICGENCTNKTEWYAKDIKFVTSGEIPQAEIWCGGFPCQSISLSGARQGFNGTSGLFFEIVRLLKGTSLENRPKYVILENVKHLLSINGGKDFTTILCELSELGYNCEWQSVNSKDFGVPQSRERVFIVGHLGTTSGRKIFPINGANGIAVKQVISGKQGNRIYDSNGLSVTLTATTGGFGGKTGLYAINMNKLDGIVKTLENANTLCSTYYKGLMRQQGQTAVMHKTYCDAIDCDDDYKQIKSCSLAKQNFANNNTICSLFEENCVNISTKCCRVRKLTPLECFRLQGFSDELFYKAKNVGISDTQLYRQSGNAITTNIAYEIGCKINEIESITV